MKLCYDLPAREEEALAACDATPMHACIPYDIEDGSYRDGYLAVTERGVYRLFDGEIRLFLPYEPHMTFSVEERRGAAALMAKVGKVEREVCLFTSRISPRFFAILPTLDALAAGKHPAEEENHDPELCCPQCGRPFVPHTENCRFCTASKKNYRALFEATKGLRLILCFPLVVALVSLAIRFIVPMIQKTAINNYLYPVNGTERGTVDKFLVIIAALISFDLLNRVLHVLQSRLAGIAGNRFDIRLRRVLFEKIESLSLASVQRRSVAYLAERINSDVPVIRDFLITRVPMVFSQIVGLVVGTILIFSVSPTLSIMVVAPLPFAVILFAVMRRRYVQHNQKARSENVRYFRYLQDSLMGERTIKGYGREDAAVKSYRYYISRTTETEIHNHVFSSVYSWIGLQIIEFGQYLLLFFGNLWLFGGVMDAGTINQFTSYTGIFYEPLRQFTTLPTEITAFVTALGQVKEILDEEPEIRDADKPEHPEIRGNIRIKGAVFGYNAYAPILRGVTLDIHEGEMIGIVGHSGCGKTTLVNLIMRLYDVGRGRIEVDGVDIRKIPQAYLRSHIGVVPQEVQLFDGTVLENIRYAKPDATMEEVIAAARAAGAHDFIVSLPEGYNTRVGDRGLSLSGGERQRVAIARALIHDPRILILDEATAALDTETEKQIQSALDTLTEGRTTIAIAHRLSTLRNANRIVVIDHGKVIEQGTHHELIEKKGRYYKLVMAQTSLAIAGVSEEV